MRRVGEKEGGKRRVREEGGNEESEGVSACKSFQGRRCNMTVTQTDTVPIHYLGPICWQWQRNSVRRRVRLYQRTAVENTTEVCNKNKQ